jgi:PAS domain S-box-containing protein
MTRASQVDPVHESAEADVSSQRPPISRGRVPVSSSCLMRYGVAVLATAATLLFRLALDAVLEDRVVFLPFTLALLVSAWYGGLGPGLLATGLGACVTVFVLLPPRWTPTVALLADGLSLVVFAIVGLGMSALVEQLHRARRRAEAEAAKRKAADEARRAHERFIQQMTDLSPVVLDVFDLVTGRHTYFSGRSVNLFGYTSEEMTQMHDQFAVLVYPDDMPRLAENLARLRRLADGEIHEFECRVRRRDGEWRWVAARSMVFARNKQGEVRQTVNAAFDVTERKRAEEALRRAHDALEQKVIEPTEQLTAINAELIKEIDERNRAQVELTRLKNALADDLEAMKRLHELSTRLLSADGLPWLLEEILSATITLQQADFGNVQLYNPHTKSLEIAVQRGERVIIEDVEHDPGFAPHRQIAASAGFRAVQSTPLVSRSGEPLGMLSTHFRNPHRPPEHELRLTDLYAWQAAEMIERERVEAALERSEAYLAEGQKLSHTGSWAWNVPTGELYWSLEHFRIFGLDPEATKPTYERFFQAIHPDDRPHVRDAFERIVRDKGDFDSEYRIVRPDGTIRHIHSMAHPVFNPSGQVKEYVRHGHRHHRAQARRRGIARGTRGTGARHASHDHGRADGLHRP